MLRNGWIFLILLFVVFGCGYKKKWEACVVENTSLRAKNKELNAENTTLSSTNTSLRTKNKHLGDRNTTLSSTNTSLGKENEKLNAENTTLSSTNTSLGKENEKLNAENTTLSSTNTSLGTKNKELNAENTTLSNRNDELTSQLEKNIRNANVAKVRNIIALAKKISFARVSDENDAKYFSQALKDMLDNPDRDVVNVEAKLNNDKSNEALKRLEEEAKDVFETRVKIVYLLFGCSHIEQGEYAKAKELLDRAIKIDSNFVDALYYRAYVYYEQNDEENAKADAMQVRKVSKGKHPDPRDLFKSLGLTRKR